MLEPASTSIIRSTSALSTRPVAVTTKSYSRESMVQCRGIGSTASQAGKTAKGPPQARQRDGQTFDLSFIVIRGEYLGTRGESGEGSGRFLLTLRRPAGKGLHLTGQRSRQRWQDELCGRLGSGNALAAISRAPPVPVAAASIRHKGHGAASSWVAGVWAWASCTAADAALAAAACKCQSQGWALGAHQRSNKHQGARPKRHRATGYGFAATVQEA